MATIDTIGISGSGCYLPKKKVSVQELAKKYNLEYKKISRTMG